MRYFYEWEDINDPHAVGHPQIEVYPQFRLKSKKAALADFREYAADKDFQWTPRIRLWKISYEEVNPT
jgi:hypothetical protein